MKLKCLGSNSKGNCYLLENDTECLVIEAGLPFMQVKKALGFNVSKIVGVVSTHVHNDHNKYLDQYKKAGIQAICFGEEMPVYDAEMMKYYSLRMENFKIKPFPLVHDVPCYGFYITHPDMGCLVYITDTEYCKYRFKNINHMLVEANYSNDLIDNEAVNRDHVLTGHMSLETALTFISTNDNPMLRNIVLIHLSDKNSDQSLFLQKTKEITDKEVHIAEKGLEVSLDLCPF